MDLHRDLPPARLQPTRPTLAALAVVLTLPFSALAQPAPIDSETAPLETECGDVTVPMKTWGGRAAVDVFLGERGPYTFLVDTGTSHAALIDRTLLDELGLELAPVESADGGADEGGRLEAFSIGGATFHGVPFLAFDIGALGSSHAPSGILGLALFESCLLTLDHPAESVRIGTGSLATDDPDVVPYRPDPAFDSLVTVPIEVAGRHLEAHVDTGSPGEVTLLDRMASELPLAAPPVEVGVARTADGESRVSSAVLEGDVVLAGHRFSSPRLHFADLGPMKATGVGNIGSGLMKDFAVTLDQANRRIRFRRAGETPAPAKVVRAAPGAAPGPTRVTRPSPGRYGIGVLLAASPDALVVDGVVPGGAAEADGLRAGDRIVAVNGTPLAEVAPDSLRTVFGTPEPVHLTVERDGETVELIVTPRPR